MKTSLRWIGLLCLCLFGSAAQAADYSEDDLGDFGEARPPVVLALDSGVNRVTGNLTPFYYEPWDEWMLDFDWFDVTASSKITSISLTLNRPDNQLVMIYALSYWLIDYSMPPPCAGCYPIRDEQQLFDPDFSGVVPTAMFGEHMPLDPGKYGLWTNGVSAFFDYEATGETTGVSYEFLITVAAVPEATSGALMGVGLLALGAAGLSRGRRRYAAACATAT